MTFDPDQLPEDDALPPGLLADLRALQRTPAVPAAVNAAVRNRARVYFASQRRVRVWVRSIGAAAAVLVVGIGVWLASNRSHERQTAESSPSAAANAPAATRSANVPFLREDIDHNGKIDVLDSFAVARGIKAGHTLPAWDVTGDGVIDQRDVDQIARAAVRVKGGRP